MCEKVRENENDWERERERSSVRERERVWYCERESMYMKGKRKWKKSEENECKRERR